jgi:hypothetical protein
MKNPDLQPDSSEAQFFESLRSGNPGVHILNRVLRKDEKGLIPPPSAIYLAHGRTHVQIFGSADECMDSLGNPAGKIPRDLGEGLEDVILHKRRQFPLDLQAKS